MQKFPKVWNWPEYILLNKDLFETDIITEPQAREHWLNYGYFENRRHKIFPIEWNWQEYILLNKDLSEAGINTESQALQHWLDYGHLENRGYCLKNYTNPSAKKMVWIIPSFNMCGGNRVILDLAKTFAKLYKYNVEVISIVADSNYEEWYGLLEVKTSKFDSHDQIKEYCSKMEIDYIFATGWQTAHLVNSIEAKKKFYFIQDYEPWFFNANAEETKATYNLPLKKFIIANWLKEKVGTNAILAKAGFEPLNIVYNPRAECKTVIAQIKNFASARNSKLVIDTLQKLAPLGLKIITFGLVPLEDVHYVKDCNIEYVGTLDTTQLYQIYEEADAVLDMSKFRGGTGICLESSRFGTVPFITNPEFGMEEYGYVDNKNFIHVQEDPIDVFNKFKYLVDNPNHFRNISENVIKMSKEASCYNTAKIINDEISLT